MQYTAAAAVIQHMAGEASLCCRCMTVSVVLPDAPSDSLLSEVVKRLLSMRQKPYGGGQQHAAQQAAALHVPAA